MKSLSGAIFYKLWMDLSNPSGLVCIKKEDKGFDEYKLNSGELIKEWPEGITFLVEGEQIEDYIVGGLHWAVISEQVSRVLQQNDPEGLQVLPVKVIWSDTGESIGPYWVLNVLREVEALDIERTKWRDKKIKEFYKHPFLNIIEEALIFDMVKEYHIFRLRIRGFTGKRIYFSERVKTDLESSGADKGFNFIPIMAY